jgi:hypothetical protein
MLCPDQADLEYFSQSLFAAGQPLSTSRKCGPSRTVTVSPLAKTSHIVSLMLLRPIFPESI